MESIEQTIVRGLLYNEEYARRVYPFLKKEFFTGPSNTSFRLYAELFDKYHKIPTMEAILISLEKQKIPDSEFQDALQFLQDIYKSRKEHFDIDWLVDETEDYCKNKAVYDAVYSSIRILDGEDKNKSVNAIPDLLDEALSVSFDTSIGTSFFDDIQKRYDYYTNELSKLKMPLNALNKLMNGGLPPKTLSAILGFTNTGKSSLMCFLAGELLKQGKNVLYISLEMSEESVNQRIEANLLDVTTDQLQTSKLDKDWYFRKIEKLRSKTVGDLFVKEYPTSSASSNHFRHLIKELKQKKKFSPDIIFVDYINICASSRYTSMNGVNSYSYVKAIAEELRSIAVEFEVAVFTATQTNREAATNQSPDMTATSESIGLPQSLDWFAAITTNEVLMDEGKQIVHLLKTRFGNKQGVRSIPIGVNFDKMRYYDLDSDNSNMDMNTPIPNKTSTNKNVNESQWDI